MATDDRKFDLKGHPFIGERYTHDVDTAQHFLADHATNPEVFIYVETPDGSLSASDYYLWPLLHRTAQRIYAELYERRREQERWQRHNYRRRTNKWVRRITMLQTLIRIRKSTVHALCAWDLQDSRPEALTVLNTERDRTGLTRQEALETVNTPERT